MTTIRLHRQPNLATYLVTSPARELYGSCRKVRGGRHELRDEVFFRSSGQTSFLQEVKDILKSDKSAVKKFAELRTKILDVVKRNYIPISASTVAMFSLIALSFAYKVKAKELEEALNALKSTKDRNDALEKVLDGMKEPATEKSVLEAQGSWLSALGTYLTRLYVFLFGGTVGIAWFASLSAQNKLKPLTLSLQRNMKEHRKEFIRDYTEEFEKKGISLHAPIPVPIKDFAEMTQSKIWFENFENLLTKFNSWGHTRPQGPARSSASTHQSTDRWRDHERLL